VVGLACHVGVPECISEVVAVFKKWIANPPFVPKPHPDLRSTVYCYGTYVQAVTGLRCAVCVWLFVLLGAAVVIGAASCRCCGVTLPPHNAMQF
jgi:hypothetical protein